MDQKLNKLKETLENNKGESGDCQTIVTCFRHLSEISRSNAKQVIELFPIDYITDFVCYSDDNELITSYQYLIQSIINTLAGVHQALNRIKNQAKLDKERTLTVGEAIGIRTHKKVDEETAKCNESSLFNIILRLIRRSSSHIIHASARDCFLALAMSNIDYNGLNYGVQLVKEGCIQDLLDIASEVEELKSPSSMDISPMTHSLVSAVLDRMYSCHDHDTVRETYREQVQQYLDKRLRNPDMDDKVRAAKVFTVLLAGPAEIGNSCVGQTGMIEMILAMAKSDEYPMQKTALDAIIAVASKKDKCQAIATHGEQILNKLRESGNEEIRLRALVGLSKVSSVGSTDASIRPFSREANPSFARDCRSIITRPTPEFTMKQHAIEALAYLSFDGDVKEELVADDLALKALFETMTFDVNSPVIYSILTVFVNLTNSYNKQETAPELVELAKFAKQHIPEEHPMDKRDILEKRLEKLINSELVTSLVQLSNIESKSSKELIARIMNALCEIEHTRGRIIQQGAVKLLMTLAQGDDKPVVEPSCVLASHALARLGITINPEFVFPGQRLISVIRPLKRLLKPECTALQNFEALMALTNLAQVNENTRAHIVNDNGFSLIEALMFEEHELIRRAAVQCVVNLIREPHLISLYEAENDRVKYLVILCQEEDLETVKAASGALAMLCQVSEKACERIFSAKQWYEILILLLSNENIELVHRAAVIVSSLVRCKNKNFAERIFESKLFEVLVALTLPQVTTVPQPIKDLAIATLKLGKERKLIRDADVNQLSHIEEGEEDDDE